MVMLNNNLRIFLVAAEKKSFTLTANELYISQPAVSRAIRALEEELATKLFYLDKRNGLILTDAGEKILLLARQMADLENRMYQIAFRDKNFQGGKDRIASIPILTSVILSKVIFRFRQEYPLVAVELIEGSSREIRKAVQEHRADFGFASSPFEDMDHMVLFTDQMVFVSRNQWDSQMPISLDQNTNQYVLCQAGYETVLGELKDRRIRFDQCLTVQQTESVINLVKEGNGIGIMSEVVYRSIPNDLLSHPVSPRVETNVGIIANDLNDLSPVSMILISMIKDACADYACKRKENRSYIEVES